MSTYEGVEDIKDAIVTVLKANMAAKVTAINAEKGDSLLAAPGVKAYFTVRRPGMRTMPLILVIADNTQSLDPISNAAHVLRQDIGIYFINKKNDPEDIQRITERFCRAVHEVIEEHPDLGGAVGYCRVMRYTQSDLIPEGRTYLMEGAVHVRAETLEV